MCNEVVHWDNWHYFDPLHWCIKQTQTFRIFHLISGAQCPVTLHQPHGMLEESSHQKWFSLTQLTINLHRPGLSMAEFYFDDLVWHNPYNASTIYTILECPRYWERWHLSCYHFSSISSYLSWSDATSACSSLHSNSTLPSLHPQEEHLLAELISRAGNMLVIVTGTNEDFRV